MPLQPESNLEKILSKGNFAVTGELGPPKSADLSSLKERAQALRGFVDACNITDNQTAIVRTSSIATAAALIGSGLEPNVQMTVRDRNRIGLQSDLLGAVSIGCRNFLCLQGDHIKFGNEPQGKNVNDLDSIQLINAVKNMRDKGVFIGGESLDHPLPKIFIGAVTNPFADPFEDRPVRLAKKIAAGAEFIQTQCIFDLPRFERWMERVRDMGLDKKAHVIGGVILLKSAGAARYMQRNIPGVIIPDELIRRLEGASDKKKEAQLLAVEIITQLREIKGLAGVHIMSLGWETLVPEIVKGAGLYPRPKNAANAAMKNDK